MFTMSLPTAASEYLPLRFEEDWGADCNKIAPKCRRIGKATTLTFGADARVRAQSYQPLDFAIGNSGGDGYTLFRGMAIYASASTPRYSYSSRPMTEPGAAADLRAPIKQLRLAAGLSGMERR